MYSGIVFAAAAVCSVAVIILGMFWYSRGFLGTIWMKAVGIDENDPEIQKKMKHMMPKGMFAGLIMNFLKALLLFSVFIAFGVSTVPQGLVVGLLVSVGFVVTSELTGALWEMKRPARFWVNGSFAVAEFIVYSLILAAWLF